MSDLKLSGNDLDVDGGELTLADGTDAIAQHLQIRLKFFLGEWFVDEREGIPYFRDVFVSNPNLSLIRSLIRRAITETPGVEAVSSLVTSFNRQQRTLTLSFEAKLTTGETLTYTNFILEV